MAEDPQKSYKAEKGTDYPDRPQTGRVEEYPEPPHPRVEEYPTTPEPPSAPQPPLAPAAPVAASSIGSNMIIWIIGGIVVLAVVGGVIVRNKLRSLPFQLEDDKVIITDSKGDRLEVDLNPQLPDDFPLDIPIFPSVELTASSRFIGKTGETTQGSVFKWETKDFAVVVMNYYLSALPANGWEVTRTSQGVTSTLIVASKGDRGLTFLIENMDPVANTEKTDIILTLTAANSNQNN